MPDRISGVCIEWLSKAPFFAEFLLRFKYRRDDNIETLGVGVEDRSITLWYSKEFIDNYLQETEVEGVLMHEILHVLHKFKERLGSRDHKIFNVAQDACINEIVEETYIDSKKLSLPKEGVRIKQIKDMGYNGDSITEPVYDFLYERADKITVSMINSIGKCTECGGSGKVDSEEDEGDVKCPNCNGSGKDDQQGGNGNKELKTIDNHGKQKEVGELDKQVIDEIINHAKSRSWGSVSGSVVSHVRELIKTKKIPWREKLSKLMTKHVHEPGNIYENTWSKRNRRGLPLPGLRKKSKKIVVTVDTSGSVSDEDLAKFFGQIEKIIKDYSQITLIQWDTQINSVKKYEKGDWKNIEINGRGGTIIQPVFDYVNEKLPKTSAIVNFTDGWFDWNINTYGIETIWALVDNFEEAPIGKTVFVKDSEDDRR